MKKKLIPIVALLVLIIQSFAAPLVAVAELVNNQPERLISLNQLNGSLRNQQEVPVSADVPVKSAETYWLEVAGNVSKTSEVAESLMLTLSSNFSVAEAPVEIIASDGRLLGEAMLSGQELSLNFLEEITGTEDFKLNVPVVYQSDEELMSDSLAILSSLGTTTIEFPVFKAIEETVIEPEENKQLEIPTIDQEIVKVPTSIVDNEISTNIITAVDFEKLEEGEPTINTRYRFYLSGHCQMIFEKR